MKLRNIGVIIFVNIIYLVAVIHGLDIGSPCANGDLPSNCTLANGSRGQCARFCSKPNIRAANVCCHTKDEHSFNLYFCCEEYSPIGGGAVGGIKTKPDEFPYMTALGWYSFNRIIEYDFKCGGVIISNKFVLTAAHCANVDGDEPVMVLPGGVHLVNNNEWRYTVDKVFEHPDYNADFVYNDIALIQLYGTFPGPTLELWRRSYIPSTNFTAIGYGDTTLGGTSSEDLLKVFLQLVAKKECQRYYEPDEEKPQGIINSQICAKDSKNIMDTCQGDSGGPLIMTVYGNNGVKKEYLVGITSYGQGCALSPPGVYTRVSAYIDWITNVTRPYREVNKTVANTNSGRHYWN